MKRSRLATLGLVAVCISLVIVVITATGAAGTFIRRSAITGGGGTATSGKVSVSGSLGQAITGQSTGSSTQLHGGWWSITNAGGSGSFIYLPQIVKGFCSGFGGTRECEDNDRPSDANGPLQFGQPILASIYDSNENERDEHTEDWFYFNWSGAGTVSIDVTNFAPIAQVRLYYESIENGSVAVVADKPNGNYHLTYDGSAGAGSYLIRLFVPGDRRPANAPDYTLVVNN